MMALCNDHHTSTTTHKNHIIMLFLIQKKKRKQNHKKISNLNAAYTAQYTLHESLALLLLSLHKSKMERERNIFNDYSKVYKAIVV